jgi:hypothetical protein
MPQAATDEETFAPHEIPLAGTLQSYIATLTRRASGTIIFRTGAGRLFRDLLMHWPSLENHENDALELCQRITDAIYPLVGDLYAQAVEITATISSQPIPMPAQIDALSTYVIFDSEKQSERVFFLSPKYPMPPAGLLGAKKGIVILCRPLNYLYHTIKDDRKHNGHPRVGIFELPQRLINELYEMPDFVPREKAIIETLRTKIQEAVKISESADAPRSPNPEAQIANQSSRPAPIIPPINSLLAFPPAIRSLERILLIYITDPTLSADLRFKLRQIAQMLLAIYPRSLIEEAARDETAHAAAKPVPTPRAIPQAFPKAIPTGNVGKLAKIASLNRTQTPLPPQATLQKLKLWAAKNPSPTFTGNS